MSSELSGTIMAAGAALVFAPAILAAAGVGAVAYGAYSVGKSAYDANKGRMAEKYHLQEGQISALDGLVSQLSQARSSLASQMYRKAETVIQSKVEAADFGTLTLEQYDQANLEALSEEARAENERQTQQADDALDFSALFAYNEAERQWAQATREDYLSYVHKRVCSLVSLNSEERAAVERFNRRLTAMAENNLSVDEVRAEMQPQLDALCFRLREEDSEQRRMALVDYLALCRIQGERPQELTQDAMGKAIKHMAYEQTKKALSGHVMDALTRVAADKGLQNLGNVELGDEEGYLLVDEKDDSCAVFVQVDEETGSFMFTTMSASDPDREGREGRARLRASAERMCDKEQALLSAMEEAGMTTRVAYRCEPDPDYLAYEPDLSYYVSQSKKRSRREAETAQRKMQME